GLDVEEGCPDRRREQGAHGDGDLGLRAATPQQPKYNQSGAVQQHQEERVVKARVRMPGGIEQVGGIPVDRRRDDGADHQHEGENELAQFLSPHDVSSRSRDRGSGTPASSSKTVLEYLY